jgi:hypothetical protein
VLTVADEHVTVVARLRVPEDGGGQQQQQQCHNVVGDVDRAATADGEVQLD